MDQEKRIIVLIDMDCFYCQVEEKLNPELEGKPIAVVQYNPWKGGGIIAVNYVARARGVTRHMRGDEAKAKCPDIQLPSVPCHRGKADITKYREAGKEVARVLQKFTPLLERASIDEAYLDITEPVQQRLKYLNINTITHNMMPNTFALGYDGIQDFISDVHCYGGDCIDFDFEHAKQLLVGALIVSEIRAAVYEETGYRCSAGIAHNKILAKLVCGMNKPNKQTILPKHSVNILYKTLPVKKVKHLGGKFGDNVCEVLRIKYMAELQQFQEKELQAKFDEKNGTWLYNIARGIDIEPVQARFNPKSIGCCKQFKGKAALTDLDSLKKWLKDLGDEIEDRLEKDALETNRIPKQMVTSFSVQMSDGRDTSSSRSYNFAPNDELCGELFSSKALELVLDGADGSKFNEGETNRRLKAPIKFLGISVGKFEDQTESKRTKNIKDFFANCGKDTIKERKENIGENKKKIEDVTVNNTNKEAKESKENISENINKIEEKAPHKDKINKDYIFHKFFNVESSKNLKVKEEKQEEENALESTLDKQESFFAKFLNQTNSKKENPTNIKIENCNRSTTPICNINTCGDDSNDTDYSGSTINAEINKSIALFEEDPEDIARVSNMRQLLRHSDVEVEKTDIVQPDVIKPVLEPSKPAILQNDIITCSECGRHISVTQIEEHADYHLALKLREEERSQARIAKKENNKERSVTKELIKKDRKKRPEAISSKNNLFSIASFLTKIDNSVPSKTCKECGKRVADEKFMEHLDFHEAQKLSREINNRAVSVSCVKRKRDSTSPLRNTKVSCKPIDLFFR